MDFNETCIILHGIIRSISSAKENPGVDYPFKTQYICAIIVGVISLLYICSF